MRLPLALAALVLAAIGAVWAWLGQPVPAPASPLAAGDKLPCVSYAPFRPGQSPFMAGLMIPAWQIDEDFERLAKITKCVRTYSTEMGLSAAPGLARKHGLTMLQGIWLGGEKEKNAVEIREAVKAANENPDVITAVIVGNEVLLRGEMSAIDLAATIRDVKGQVKVPVTYADVWEFWERNRDLANAVDFVTIHILPFWEDLPVSADKAVAHIDAIRSHMGEVFAGRDILIGETGWPSAGRMREGAEPSPSNQAEGHPGAAGACGAEELPGERHRGVRPAVEAGAGRHGGRPLGLPRRLFARLQVRLGPAGLRPSGLDRPGAGRHGAGARRVRRGLVDAAPQRKRAAERRRMGRGRRHRAARRPHHRAGGGGGAGREPRRRRLAAQHRHAGARGSLRRCWRRRASPRVRAWLRSRPSSIRRSGAPRPASSSRSPARAGGERGAGDRRSRFGLVFDPRYKDFQFAGLPPIIAAFAFYALAAPSGIKREDRHPEMDRGAVFLASPGSISRSTRPWPIGRACGPARCLSCSASLCGGALQGRANEMMSSPAASAARLPL